MLRFQIFQSHSDMRLFIENVFTIQQFLCFRKGYLKKSPPRINLDARGTLRKIKCASGVLVAARFSSCAPAIRRRLQTSSRVWTHDEEGLLISASSHD